MPRLLNIFRTTQIPEKKEKFLGEGFFSTVHLTHKNGTPIVIKRPRKGINKERWCDEIDSTFEGLKELENLNVPVFIPKILQRKSNYIIEEYATGEHLTAELYYSLPIREQDKIAQDIAVFLNEMHQKKLQVYENHKPRTYYSDYYFNQNLEKIIDSQMVELYKNTSTIYDLAFIGQTQGIAHRDLRFENILYDKNTKKVSVIDFGQMLNYEDIYTDFAPNISKPIGLPWELTKKIIERYNALEKNTPVFIDINLVRDMQLAKLFNIFSETNEVFEVFRNPRKISHKALKVASDIFEKDFKPQIMERLADRPSDGHTTPEMRYRPYLFKARLAQSKNSR